MHNPLIVMLSAVVGAVFLLLAGLMWHTWKEHKVWRETIADRIGVLRIHRMLALMGVSTGKYLRGTHPAVVEKHLSRCQYCSETRRCDEWMAGRDRGSAEEFCPNFKALQAYKDRRVH